MTGRLITCGMCGGSGEIHWNQTPNNDPQYDESEDCPRCNGDGTLPFRPVESVPNTPKQAPVRWDRDDDGPVAA